MPSTLCSSAINLLLPGAQALVHERAAQQYQQELYTPQGAVAQEGIPEEGAGTPGGSLGGGSMPSGTNPEDPNSPAPKRQGEPLPEEDDEKRTKR